MNRMENLLGHSDEIVKGMIEFLETSEDEADDNFRIKPPLIILGHNTETGYIYGVNRKRKRSTLEMEMKKLKDQFPLWTRMESDDNGVTVPVVTNEKKFQSIIKLSPNLRSIWSDGWTTESDPHESWALRMQTNSRRNGNSFVQEVNRAIFGSTDDLPLQGSRDYYKLAQKYAIHGKDLTDFPENLMPLLNARNSVSPQFCWGNGLFPPPNSPTENSNGPVPNCNYNKPIPVLATPIPATTTSNAITPIAAPNLTNSHFPLWAGFHPQVRPGNCNNPYGVFIGNKIPFMAGPPHAGPPVVYNQHLPANYIPTNFANAAIAAPSIIYSNPSLATQTQQYLNTFLKEAHYLNCVQGQASSNGIYERLVYAQMLQQQIYYHSQQQAMAAMFQQQKSQRPPIRQANGMFSTAMPNQFATINLNGRQNAVPVNFYNYAVAHNAPPENNQTPPAE